MYTSSNNNYAEGYTRAIDRHKDFASFVPESNTEEQFYGFLKNSNDVVGLFTDDCIFYRRAEFSESDIRWFLGIENIWAIHLRLGLNITVVDYVRSKPCPQPNYNICPNDKFICWDYRFTDKFESYFAFPTPFDGSFYNGSDLLSLANNGNFNQMILWENMICNNGRQQLMNKNIIVAPLQSHVVAQNINSSHSYGLRSKNWCNISLEELNNRYLDNQIIDIDSMDFSNIRSAHDEIRFSYKKI